MESLLHKLWYDPATGFTSGLVLYTRAKQENPRITRAFVEEWLGKQRTAQLHAPARKAKNVGFISAEGVDARWQADRIDMSAHPAVVLRGGKTQMLWILVVVDVFSRRLHARALPSKHATVVSEAFNDIVSVAETYPEQLDTDQGPEFGKTFDKETGIGRHERAKIGDHRALGVVDAAINLFKRMVYKYITNDKGSWAKDLQHLVDNFNSQPRKALNGFTPLDINPDGKPSLEVFMRQAHITTTNRERKEDLSDISSQIRYKIGDKVSEPAQKGPFKRGFKQQMTEKTYPVTKVNAKSVEVDVDGQVRRYLFDEIADTGVRLDEDVWELEKIFNDKTRKIKRGKKSVTQKWVRFKTGDEQWVDEGDIMTSS